MAMNPLVGPYMYFVAVILVLGLLALKLLLRARPTRIMKRQLSSFIDAEAAKPPRPPITDAEIETEILIGRRLEAIKLYRERSGCDLKTAVEAIDAMTARLRPGS
jgi:hypothetical protein